MGNTGKEFVAEELWLLIAIVTIVLVSLAGIAGLEALAGAISIIGLILLVPVFLFWGEEIAAWVFDESTTSPREIEDDEFSELKRRYARGEIDEETFEQRLDRLLEANERAEGVGRSGPNTGDESTPERNDDWLRDRERDLE